MLLLNCLRCAGGDMEAGGETKRGCREEGDRRSEDTANTMSGEEWRVDKKNQIIGIPKAKGTDP